MYECEVCMQPIYRDQPFMLCESCPFSAVHRGDCLTVYREATGNTAFVCEMCEEYGSESASECLCPECAVENGLLTREQADEIIRDLGLSLGETFAMVSGASNPQ